MSKPQKTAKAIEWLQSYGYIIGDVAEEEDEASGILLMCPTHRLLQEADDLVCVLRERGLSVVPSGDDETIGIRLQAGYDPVDGTSYIDIRGLDDNALLRNCN